MAMIEALIFDMDGVIVDSEPLHLMAYQEILSKSGHAYTEADNREFLGQKDIVIAAVLVERFNLKTTPEAFVEHKERILDRLITRHATPQPGLMEILDNASNARIPCAVASSATMPTIGLVVDTLGIRPYFANLTSGDEVRHGKPAPDVFLLAASRLGIAPEYCLVIEDTQAGIKAAKSAGMYCISIPCETTRHQDHSQADTSLDNLAQIDLAHWAGMNPEKV